MRAPPLLKTDTIRLNRDKDYAIVPPLLYIRSMVVKTKRRQFQVFEISAMEMHKKRKKDRVLGMPIYFSLMAGDHKILVYPVPSSQLTAAIEFMPMRESEC